MSSYIVEEEGETTLIINGVESESYHLLYSDLHKRRKGVVLKQMMKNWYEVEKQMRFFIMYNIDTDDFMKRVSKIYFLTLRASKEQENDIKQRNKSNKERIKKLNKLRKTKNPI